MDIYINRLYLDFFDGCILTNDCDGIDTKGDIEYGIGSRTSALGILMIYPLRHKIQVSFGGQMETIRSNP